MSTIKIMDRYIFLELLPPFFLGLASITLVLFIQKMFRMAELVIAKGVSFGAALKLFLFILPGFLVITIPVSMLLASLIAFSRLSSDSEIPAMKASRISLYRMLRPVAALSLLTCAVTAALSLAVLPHSNQALKEQMFSMVKSSAMVSIEPGVFTNKFNGMVIYVDKMSSSDLLEGIFIADERSTEGSYIITAKRGRLIADPQSLDVVLAMEDGAIHTAVNENKPFALTSFASGRLFMDINSVFLQSGQTSGGPKQAGTIELLRDIRIAKRDGAPVAPLESELHTRLSIPFACLVFGLVGAPLGIRRARSGRSAGIVTAVAVFLGYYVVLGSSKNMSLAGVVAPALAYWIPNILIAVASAVVIYKKGHEIRWGISDRLAMWYYRLKRRWDRLNSI